MSSIRIWQQQIGRFGLTGILNTLIDYGLLNLLAILTGIHSGLGLGLLNIIAVAAAATNSYFWNRYWTFGAVHEKHCLQVKRFIVATGAGMIVSSMVVAFTSSLIAPLLIPTLLALNVSKLSGEFISAAWNFLVYRYWVFKKHDRAPFFSESFTPGLVSVIIPAFNEKERLPSRLTRLAESLPLHFPVDIIVVDDGSTDSTRLKVEEVASNYSNIRCVGYSRNRGKGYAVRAGMRVAAGEFLIFTDADDSFTEEHIVKAAEQMFKGEKVVIGCRRSRTGKGRMQGEPVWQKIFGRVFNQLAQWAVLPGITDTQCGLKGFRREAAAGIFSRQKLNGFAFDVELLALARELNYEIAQVGVEIVACEGSRVNRILSSFKMGWDLLRIKAGLLVNAYDLPQGGLRLREAAFGSLLFIAALVVRLPWLWEVPRYVDELKEVNLSYLIFRGQALPLHNMAHDIGAMHNYILAGIFELLGPGIYWPRLYVAVTSALTVVLVYFWSKKLFGRWTALIAAGLLLTNGIHILVSHMAWSNCTTSFFLVLALFATTMTEDKASGKWLVIAALLWASALQTHSSVIVYILTALIYVLRPSFLRKTGIGRRWYGAAAGAFVLGYSNMIYYNIVSNWGSITWLSNKPYALESSPGLHSFLRNFYEMSVEFLRSLSSTYNQYTFLWQYFLNPILLIATALLIYGAYLAVRRGKSLPVWMIAGGFAVIPVLNSRYVFYLSTRYIMPVVVCGLILMAYGLVEVTRAFLRKWELPRSVLVPVACSMVLLMIAQLVPFYMYCASKVKTNDSNRLTLNVVSQVNKLAMGGRAVVLLDNKLPLENSPLSYIYTLTGQPFKIVGQTGAGSQASSVYTAWEGMIKRYHNQRVVAVMTESTFKQLQSHITARPVKEFSCKVILPDYSPKPRVIYVTRVYDRGCTEVQ